MKKALVVFILLFYFLPLFGQENTSFDSTKHYLKIFKDNTEFDIRKFKPFPSFEKVYSNNTSTLIDSIIPAPGYVYWECRYVPANSRSIMGQVVVSKGDIESYQVFTMLERPKRGFFVECLPNICYSYIVGVREDLSIDLIGNEKELIQFMGEVDNIEEVLLQVKANGYWYDKDTLLGGSYREEDDRYLLYLMKYSNHPVTQESVKAILYKNGRFEVISKVTYKKRNIYISN